MSAATRYRIDGSPISNVIQNSKCFGCGMGLCDPREWHPYVACETFEREHHSGKVWAKLRELIRAEKAPWQAGSSS